MMQLNTGLELSEPGSEASKYREAGSDGQSVNPNQAYFGVIRGLGTPPATSDRGLAWLGFVWLGFWLVGLFVCLSHCCSHLTHIIIST